jgi:hypothetical protein
MKGGGRREEVKGKRTLSGEKKNRLVEELIPGCVPEERKGESN